MTTEHSYATKRESQKFLLALFFINAILFWLYTYQFYMIQKIYLGYLGIFACILLSKTAIETRTIFFLTIVVTTVGLFIAFDDIVLHIFLSSIYVGPILI